MKVALVIGLVLWLPIMLFRFVLMIVLALTVVPLSLVMDGAENTPGIWRWLIGNVKDLTAKEKRNRFTKWWAMSVRNPATGLDWLVRQPIPEIHPNPDELVRGGHMKKATRWMQHGIFWEYWTLSAMENGKFWEKRVGWKFVDGNDDFVPTFQLGPKK